MGRWRGLDTWASTKRDRHWEGSSLATPPNPITTNALSECENPPDAQGLRTLAPVLREQSFGLKQLLFPLPGTVALPRLSQAQKQLRRVRLLGSVNMAFELLTEAARLAVGFHLAHYPALPLVIATVPNAAVQCTPLSRSTAISLHSAWQDYITWIYALPISYVLMALIIGWFIRQVRIASKQARSDPTPARGADNAQHDSFGKGQEGALS